MINNRRPYLLALFTTLIVLFSDGYFFTALGLGLFTFVMSDFVRKMGSTIPILEAMLLISCLQWIVGPYLDYTSAYRHYKYHMYVPEELYMDLVVPSLFCFALPIYYFSARIDYSFYIKRILGLKISDGFAFGLVAIGFLSDAVIRFVPPSLGFVFYLASGVKFVGLLYLFFSGSKKKWLVFGIVFSTQFLGAISGGLFHGLLLWTVFMMIFMLIVYQVPFTNKLFLISVGFASMFVLQSIKSEFREKTWKYNYPGNKVELFTTLFLNKVENIITGKEEKARIDFFKDEEDEINEANNRLNQGWIISKIMSHIPVRSPYLEGETIREAVVSSLIPRFLMESKAAGGGGRLTYEKLTGFHLQSRTSMGTGILGEAYGNYGVEGTYLFMFFWGLFVALLFKFIFNRAKAMPLLPLWLPIIFLQAVKAETDLFTVLNHLVKSTVFVFGFIYIAMYVFKVRFRGYSMIG